jgi:hypothetical protein
MEVHLIPSNAGYFQEPLFPLMGELGVKVHPANEWSVLQPEDPVMAFCNGDFFESLPAIHKRTKRTIFVNCMTWLFDKEKESMAQGMISMFLYQNDEVRQAHENALRAINANPEVQFMTFKPYFENQLFPYVSERASEFFGCGRISRQDADKFSANTLHIYEYFVSPKWKRAIFLGFDERSQAKIGTPYNWIRTARDHHECSTQEFYKHCEIILQPSDTTENWPRIGFEAMASGSVLIVDNRGGWKKMIRHGVTGWLCDHERDFIYYASKMAYEPNLRHDMACAAREHGLSLGGMEASMESWKEVFHRINLLPV